MHTDRSRRLLFFFAIAFVVFVRVVCFPFTWENGDAPSRIAMAAAWLQNPSIMSAKDCSQFGPLPIYLIAGILALWNDPYVAPRFLSLLFGVATAVPLFLIARDLFGQRAATLTLLFFALFSLQVRGSAMSLSEVPFGFLLLMCIFFFLRFRRQARTSDLVFSALLLSLAALVRYEGWLFIPLMALLAIRSLKPAGFQPRHLAEWLEPAFVFGALAGLCPLVWMVINYVQVGDPLPIVAIADRDFTRIGQEMTAHRGAVGTLLYCLLFLPGTLFLSLTPLVLFLVVLGFCRCLWRRQALVYAALLLPYVLHFGQTLALQVTPQARYLVALGLLLLPFAGMQADVWSSSTSPSRARGGILAVMLSALAVFLFLSFAAYRPSLPFQQKFWSVAPVGPLLPEQKTVYEAISRRMAPGDRIFQTPSPYSQIIVFNLSRATSRDWLGRLMDADSWSADDWARFLKSAPPGFLLLDKEAAPNADRALRSLEEQRPGAPPALIFSDDRFTVYRLAPR